MEIFKNIAVGLSEYRKSVGHILSDNPLPLLVTGLVAVHKAHFLAAMYEEKLPCTLLLITESESSAAKITEDINTLCKTRAAYQFPAADILLTDTDAGSKEYTYRRIEALFAAMTGKARLIVASAESAVQLTVPKGVLESATITVSAGDEVDLSELISRLCGIGYSRCDMIDGRGQFSVRGDILDIYPVNSSFPVRIELWGEEVDSISRFDTETQRRSDSLDKISITPTSETIFQSPEILKEKLSALLAKAERLKAKNPEAIKRIKEDIARIDNGLSPLCPERYYPLCYDETATVFDYANKVIVSESFTAGQTARDMIKAHIDDLKLLTENGYIIKGLDRYLLNKTEITGILDNASLYLDAFARGGGKQLAGILKLDAMQLSAWSGEYKVLCDELREYMEKGFSVVIFGGTEKAAKILAQDLRDSGFPSDYSTEPKKAYVRKIYVVAGALSSGFSYSENKSAVLTCTAFTGKSEVTAKRKYKKGATIRTLSDISRGDIVVHAYRGIGIFEGVEKITVDKISKDYIKIKYAGTDVLYVPVTQLDVISRYIGGDTENVKLTKLHSDQWKKTKAKAKAAASEMADELIKLYAKRMRAQGFAFSPDEEKQHIFENHFSYIETDDQLRCADEIKRDMQKPQPMERLLCGDVGFGKTEVALRAAFKCVSDGKQCAILVPTTVLAWQHYQTVLKRMEGFDVKAELLSRFRSPSEQKEILKKLYEGDIDIIIGTHRLVQDDVKFFDLGLVIIDEEQRFGVNHKEKLKEMHPGVDILTLSATPIPRTLNMAMSGIRDMSVIETPPGDRQPITTYVTEQDDGIIAQAINKELRRNGQVYYIHNRIDSIYSCAAHLQQLIPDASIGVAHGRMNEEELMDVWRRLIEGDINLLVCTTLIETGVDVPNVNTLIIENADRMGLAQLHQLRGRVGRTGRRAYAYFTYKKGKQLTEIASDRLEAIREFTRFGSGFRIAMKDLEIRGAGSVLGQSQSGHLSGVGYDMYIKLLNQAVAESRGEKPEIKTECLVDIKLDAFIPESYISNQAQRIDCYRRIAMVETAEDAYDVTDELIDRYGDLPKSVAGLIEVARLRKQAQRLAITEIIENNDSIMFYPEAENGNIGENVFGMLSAAAGEIKNAVLVLTGKVNLRINGISKSGGNLAVMKAALDAMSNAVNSDGKGGNSEKQEK